MYFQLFIYEMHIQHNYFAFLQIYSYHLTQIKLISDIQVVKSLILLIIVTRMGYIKKKTLWAKNMKIPSLHFTNNNNIYTIYNNKIKTVPNVFLYYFLI